VINIKGCNCPKTKCLKKYCECFSHNLKCSPLCECFDCHNKDDFIMLPEDIDIPKTNYNKYKKSIKIFGTQKYH
jgi:hypothetical protein